MDNTAPQPQLGSCCTTGVLDTSGTPAGTCIVVGGIPTYVSSPPVGTAEKGNGRALVLLPDIFGWDTPNTRLLADRYSAAGWKTYVPDLQSGDGLPLSYEPALAGGASDGILTRIANGFRFAVAAPTAIAWLKRHDVDVTTPLIDAFLGGLRKEQGIERIGVLGYCWGGRFALLLGGSGKPEVRAVAPIHMAGVTLPKDVVALRVPAWFGFGAVDGISPSESSTRAALRGASADVQAACEIKTYAGCAHGYAIRGDMHDATVAAARKDTVVRTLAFFDKHV